MSLHLEKFIILYVSVVTMCFASIINNSNQPMSRSKSQNSRKCYRDAVCHPLHNATCFGEALPYTHTSFALAADSESAFDIQDKLTLWQGLQYVPKCWSVVQPLLCAVYMPKCENGTIYLPSHEVCHITRNPCGIVEMTKGWPSFLKCQNAALFPSGCKSYVEDIKFNVTKSKCMSPLKETNVKHHWLEGVENCGLPCQDPLYTNEEYKRTHLVLVVCASVILVMSLLAVMTLIVSIYNATSSTFDFCLLYINLSSFITSVGRLLGDSYRNDIVCHQDGTMFTKPQSDGSIFCQITFGLVCGSSTAAVLWSLMLAYTLYNKNCLKDTTSKLKRPFILIGFIVPTALTIFLIQFSELHGDYVTGLCYVKLYEGHWVWLLIFLGIAAVATGCFLARVIYHLIKITKDSEDKLSKQTKDKIWRFIRKLGSMLSTMVASVSMTIAYHLYVAMYEEIWRENLRNYLMCLAENSAQSHLDSIYFSKCSLKDRPNNNFLVWLMVSYGFYALAMALWVFNKQYFEIWKKFIGRMCAPPEKGSSNWKKHRLVSQAYLNRNQFCQGNYSFSFNSNPDDPAGVDVNRSIASEDVSHSFIMALPRMTSRRNACPYLTGLHHYSSASDISHHYSVDSFNQSNLDTLSIQMSEEQFAVLSRQQRRKTKRERERLWRANRCAWVTGSRRGSDTSLQSSLLAAIKNTGMVTKSTSTSNLQTPVAALAVAAFNNNVVQPQRLQRLPIQRDIYTPTNPRFMHGMDAGNQTVNLTNLSSTVMSSERCTPMQSTPIVTFQPQAFNHASIPLNCMCPPNAMHYPVMPGAPFGCYFTPFAGGMPFYPHAFPNNMSSCGEADLLPMHPRVDSGSETDFLPMFLTDSEGGQRSQDESQILTTRLIQERMQAQMAAHPEVPAGNKPVLEPQECAKTQFLKKMNSFNTMPTAALVASNSPTGRKSPYNEAPPPSPAEEATKSSNEGDDDVFEE